MPQKIIFTHPEPAPVPSVVWPVFLPFAGCPYRCIYCAQEKQTGSSEADLETIIHTLEEDLDSALAEGRGPYELACDGGTFTVMPSPWPEMFLGLAVRYRERGMVTHIRCSTRPDCVDERGLAMLRAQGLDMVELGIQSFDDSALKKTGRGYTGETACIACQQVKEAGLSLGIQLLPGLPGDRPGVFARDARMAADLIPDTTRLYPCLVIRDTALANIWERGGYEPWTLEHTKIELAAAVQILWEKDVRIIRLGLPPEGTLAEHILAGPWHPALGQSVRGLALFEILRVKVREFDDTPTRLDVPRRYQGELMGHANELAGEYAALGLTKEMIRYVDTRKFELR